MSPTSLGMKKWYIREVKKCKACKEVYLIREKYKVAGKCADCMKKEEG